MERDELTAPGRIVMPRPGASWRPNPPPAPVGPDPPIPAPEPPLPSLARRAANLAGAAAAVVANAVATGGVLVASDATQDARRRTCQQAEGLTEEQTVDGHCNNWRPSDDYCGDADGQGCGCNLPGKRTLAARLCPRWRE